MKRLFLGFAALAVLVAYTWVLGSASLNRREARAGTAELTEHELHRVPMPADSTVMLLELRWGVRGASTSRPREAPWLNVAKLGDLGFDCRVPIGSPIARDHYRALTPMQVFAVLEIESDPTESATTAPVGKSRLKVIDAGRDPARLRVQYPDRTRNVLTRAVVSIGYLDHDEPQGPPLERPRVQGWIDALLPSQIYVPPPYGRQLANLRSESNTPEASQSDAVRFTATIDWGTDYLPCVRGLRLLGTNAAPPPARPADRD